MNPTRSSLTDKTGELFTLEEDCGKHGWILNLWDRHGYRAGHAYLTIAGRELRLGDLVIEDAVVDPSHPAFRWLQCIGFRRPRHRDLRRRGLGSALLLLIETRAREAKFKSIRGGIVTRDLARWPHLPDWYRRHGFTVRPNTQADEIVGELIIEKTLT